MVRSHSEPNAPPSEPSKQTGAQTGDHIRLIRPPAGSVPELGIIAPPGGFLPSRVGRVMWTTILLAAGLGVGLALILGSVLDHPGPWPSLVASLSPVPAGLWYAWWVTREIKRDRERQLAPARTDPVDGTAGEDPAG